MFTSYLIAHRSYPFGTLLRATNVLNGKHVVVRVNDQGPLRRERIIGLSWGAAKAIGMIFLLLYDAPLVAHLGLVLQRLIEVNQSDECRLVEPVGHIHLVSISSLMLSMQTFTARNGLLGLSDRPPTAC